MEPMTASEAAAVNVMISYLAGQNVDLPADVVRSLHVLAGGAHNRLHGGWNQDAVRTTWPTSAFDDVQRAPADPADVPVIDDTPVNSA